MSERKFIFRGGSRELVLPVTPGSYQVETGINVEVVNIHTLGDAILTGYGTLATIKISCMFPAQDYPFSRDSGPERYVEQFQEWCKDGAKLRFVVSGTGVNVPVVVRSISYGERDGTGDVYANLILREYRKLKAAATVKTVVKTSSSYTRAPVENPTPGTQENYVAKAGDTAASLIRRVTGAAPDLVKAQLAIQTAIAAVGPSPVVGGLIAAGTVISLPKLTQAVKNLVKK